MAIVGFIVLLLVGLYCVIGGLYFLAMCHAFGGLRTLHFLALLVPIGLGIAVLFLAFQNSPISVTFHAV